MRPVLSRNVVPRPVAVEDPVVRPVLSRYVVRLPEVAAVPVTRPVLSRNVVLFPELVAVPVVRPVLSRKVVLFPCVDAVPVVRPVGLEKLARSPELARVPYWRVKLSLPGVLAFALFSASAAAGQASSAKENAVASVKVEAQIARCVLAMENIRRRAVVAWLGMI